MPPGPDPRVTLPAEGTKATKPAELPMLTWKTVDRNWSQSGATIWGNAPLTRLHFDPGSSVTVLCGVGLAADGDAPAVRLGEPKAAVEADDEDPGNVARPES
jgi:hypothetical protein